MRWNRAEIYGSFLNSLEQAKQTERQRCALQRDGCAGTAYDNYIIPLKCKLRIDWFFTIFNSFYFSDSLSFAVLHFPFDFITDSAYSTVIQFTISITLCPQVGWGFRWGWWWELRIGENIMKSFPLIPCIPPSGSHWSGEFIRLVLT